MHLLGVRMDPIRREKLRQSLARLLESGSSHMVITPNPEMLVQAHRSPELREVLNRATMTVPDGVGLQYAARLLGRYIGERTTGVDLVYLLAYIAMVDGKRILLVGGGELGVSHDAAHTLRQAFPGLDVHAIHGGAIARLASGAWHQDHALIHAIRGLTPDIICVALGHSKQEHWIHDHLPHLPSVKIAVGVGGALDYYAGRVRRAPRWMQHFGLEWLWRLIKEPHRLRRIITAIIIFPLLVVRKG